MGGVKRDGEGRRVDPRMKYSHLKIKSKGNSSPNQSSLKQQDPPSFKIPKLLQDSSALAAKPMDPRDLFKGAGGMLESGYDTVSAPFGMFKSNFLPRSQLSQEATGSAKQPFGEITLKDPRNKDAESAKQSAGRETVTEKDSSSFDTDTSSVDGEHEASTESSKPQVPSYFAQLDVGLGNDLKIDSAFGSLAGNSDDGSGEVGGASKQAEESQARKLPSMFGLGF